MYSPGQIVWDVAGEQPVKIGNDVWDKSSYPDNFTTHFEDKDGNVVCPPTIEAALQLLKEGKISPKCYWGEDSNHHAAEAIRKQIIRDKERLKSLYNGIV